jgi:acyl dehydratase
MSEFEVFHPGQFSAEDQAALDGYVATCKAINERGPIDPTKLAKGELAGTPGVGEGHFASKELKPWEVAYETSNYDPENPLYNDEAYAKKLGYKTTPVLPIAQNFGDGNAEAMPAELRDNLVISGLNHVVTFHAPVYPGDTLYPVCDHREVEELTPAGGSELRTFAIYGSGCVYNQNGELVTSSVDRVKESLRRHTDPAKRNATPIPTWECPDWWDLRARHKYTDADWELIKGVWANEPKPHDDPIYWEDVKVGDEPFEFIEGPVTQLDTIKYHGLGEIGSPSLKVLMNDPFMSKALLHDEITGEYHEMNGVGHLEDGYVPNHRPCFYNHMPIYYVCRAAQNWIGNTGTKLDTVAWRIMNNLPGYEKDIPEFPDPDSYIAQVPALAGKTITTHGMVGDLIWIKSYVTEKYEENGEKFVKVVYWIQTIEEEIYEEGYVIVKLPSKQ